MDEAGVEAAILAINALGAGILLFVSGVVQPIMNDMDEPAFKKFALTLVNTATGDPFAITIGTIPIFAVVLYFVTYGFAHWWFTAGIALWMVGSSITKITNLPVYRWIRDPRNVNPEELRRKRHTLQLGNNWRAWITLLSVIAMVCQFSVAAAALALGSCLLIMAPALWLSRKYFTN
jgi:hypothetical protein